MPLRNALHAPLALLQARPRWLIVVAAALFQIYESAVYVPDPDIWWHLRAGEWITAHHAVPALDPFPVLSVPQRWVDYSWAFDLLAYGIHHVLGYAGLIIFTVIMALAIAWAVEWLCRPSWLVLAGALWAIRLNLTPRPWLFSMLLMAITLGVVRRVQAGALRRQWLIVIPVLFACWANLHIQVVSGLGVLAVVAVLARAERKALIVTTGAAALAVLANPYGVGVYAQALAYAGVNASSATYVTELVPLSVRDPANWIALALFASPLALALRKGPLHERVALVVLGLVALAAPLRMQRDAWLGALVAAFAVLTYAGALTAPAVERPRVSAMQAAVCLALATLVLGGRGLSERSVARSIALHFPVRACNAARAHGVRGKVFVDFGWGSYLMYCLPSARVSIDGRGNLYPTSLGEQSIRSWNAEPGWSSDPDLTSSQAVIGRSWTALSRALSSDPRFSLAYNDGQAVVFMRR